MTAPSHPLWLPISRHKAELYENISDEWFSQLLRQNGVRRDIDFSKALKRDNDPEFMPENAVRQYFDLDSTVDVVVFGHTGLPFYREYGGYARKKILANSESWLDSGGNDPNNPMSFVLVESTPDDTEVSVQKCLGTEKVDDIVPIRSPYTESNNR